MRTAYGAVNVTCGYQKWLQGPVYTERMNIKLGSTVQKMNPLLCSHKEIWNRYVLSSKVYLKRSYIRAAPNTSQYCLVGRGSVKVTENGIG